MANIVSGGGIRLALMLIVVEALIIIKMMVLFVGLVEVRAGDSMHNAH